MAQKLTRPRNKNDQALTLNMLRSTVAEQCPDWPSFVATVALMTQDMIDTDKLDAFDVAEVVESIGLIRDVPPEKARQDLFDALRATRKSRYGSEDDPKITLPKVNPSAKPDVKPDTKPISKVRPIRDDVPIIETFNRTLDELSRQAWDAVRLANKPVRLFQRGGIPLRIERDETGMAIREITADKMRFEIGRAAAWQRRGDYVLAPKEIAVDMLSSPEFPLPVLNRVVPVPIFAPDGTLETSPGYSPKSGNYYAPVESVEIIPASDNVTAEECQAAVELIWDEVLVDFPLKGAADIAAAMALFIQPFVREMIAGPTPCFLLDSSMNGSGKTMLGEVLLYPSQLKWPSLISEIGSPEEMEKMLSSALLSRDAVLFIDNVNSKVGSGVLANYLTATTKKIRRLGKSETIEVPVRPTWVMTGANLELTNENARRCVHSRLEPKTGTPELRTGFKHEFLKEWVEEHASELIHAAHTMVLYWIQKGRPSPKGRPMGSYERWYQVIGGILETAGVLGFLSNLEEFHAEANSERSSWTEFVNEWWNSHGDSRVTVSNLMAIAENIGGLDIYGNTDRGRVTYLGKLLKQNRARIYGGFRINKAGVCRGMTEYALTIADGS